MDFILTTQMRISKRGAFDTDFVDCFFLYESRVSLGVKNCAFEQKHILKYQYQVVGILNIATFEVHNMYKRFTVTVVSDLIKVISKQTPPLNKGRIGNAENEINAPTFNRMNTVADRKFFWIFGFMSHSDRILTDCPNHFPDFNLESFSFFNQKYIYYEKSDQFP